ncbi:MAG: MFS transporter [Alphaproteobacteria bacterium]|nr:MAG: MFS transporter [Alphaproteobacteria bacterium]
MKQFKYWQARIFASIFIGYAGFYLIRNNIFSYAFPLLQKSFGYSNFDIGVIITLGNLVHAFGKGINGLISDRVNARYFMSFGLLGSALMVMSMSFSQSFTSLVLLYMLHQGFQSMGWPPCAKLLSSWFTKQELGLRWSLLNASQQFGGLAAYFVVAFVMWMFSKDWHFIFFVPAFLSLCAALFLFVFLRDTPESMGFESVCKTDKKIDLYDWKVLKKLVYKNPLVLYVCCANFFLYYVRMSLIIWAPKFLAEFKQVKTLATITNPAMKDVCAVVGGIVAGYISDHIFKGDRGIVSTIYMVVITILIFVLWQLPGGNATLLMFLMGAIGFFLTGPQILIGISATDYSDKRLSGAATGLTGFFGYAGTALTGVGSGWLLDHFGWNAFFFVVCVSGVCASAFLALAWYKRLNHDKMV